MNSTPPIVTHSQPGLTRISPKPASAQLSFRTFQSLSIDFIVSHLLAPAIVPDQIHVRFVPMYRVSGSALVDSLDSKEMREARLVGWIAISDSARHMEKSSAA